MIRRYFCKTEEVALIPFVKSVLITEAVAYRIGTITGNPVKYRHTCQRIHAVGHGIRVPDPFVINRDIGMHRAVYFSKHVGLIDG
jgi:hypothetical protein